MRGRDPSTSRVYIIRYEPYDEHRNLICRKMKSNNNSDIRWRHRCYSDLVVFNSVPKVAHKLHQKIFTIKDVIDLFLLPPDELKDIVNVELKEEEERRDERLQRR